ncbi:hypothetical protein [Acidocella aminolytica]|uniref:Phage protein n=1 Tax=Acidocella aminolytica 101 = DSM 11237 TaxID=1120923 RepID=A0A0D6PFY9_9PROT|nr:hypothetical protein [Acidocella aminolytica]GAN79774.1 hypothetical protein Aam_030_007 [Acidocella aminolytica 101 = DSM 11237]GBQ32012.1 hypothetical protein AA11237_0042 [Acidocella aminolytica 101 = DSM 11237]SHF35826.1 hypothetical protein SAMN02746095_02958 [Acidocella aminolytica 101 = DSM 11237]
MEENTPLPPSAATVKTATLESVVTDAKGRKIAFRPLGILDQARIYKAVGADNSENGPYVRLATMAASVTSIDGVPTPASPTNDREVEAAIARLGDEGFLALSLDLNAKAEAAIAAAQEAAASAKN